jgi:hypothetical protein
MRAVPIARNILWAEGAFLCLSVPRLAYHLVEHSYRQSTLLVVVYASLAYLFLVGLSALAAAYALEQNWQAGRGALKIASILNLLVIPLGTLLGIWGLWLTIKFPGEAILDGDGGMASPKRLSRTSWSWPGRLALAAQFTGGVLLIPMMAERLKAQGSPLVSDWNFAAQLVAAVIVGVLFHEVGHVLAGRAVGFRFLTLSAGPLVISRMSDGWRVQWVNSMGLWNGMALMAPGGPNLLRMKTIVFILGGPVGSLLCGGSALALMSAAPRLHLNAAAEFFGILGVIELVNGIANLLPFQTPGGFTDGSRLVQLIARQPEGLRFLAELAFGLSDTTSLRPKDWHPAWLHAVTRDEASPGFSRGCYYAYVNHLDRGEIDDASVWLARCMDSHKALRRDPYRSILAMENAFFEARHLKNAQSARDWLSVPRVGIPAERFMVLRVRAAIHIAEGEHALAAEVIGTALRLHAVSLETGHQQFERAVLRDVEDWLDELTGASTLSRLAQAVKERDSLIAASKLLEPLPARIQRLLRPQP